MAQEQSRETEGVLREKTKQALGIALESRLSLPLGGLSSMFHRQQLIRCKSEKNHRELALSKVSAVIADPIVEADSEFLLKPEVDLTGCLFLSALAEYCTSTLNGDRDASLYVRPLFTSNSD